MIYFQLSRFVDAGRFCCPQSNTSRHSRRHYRAIAPTANLDNLRSSAGGFALWGDKMIYVIRSGAWIKLGVSARPWERLAEFQTANPEPLEMLAIGPGDFGLEGELHRLFGEHRGVGEWFKDNERIRAVVKFFCETFPELQVQPQKTEQMATIEPMAKPQERRSTGEGWLEFRSVYTRKDGSRRYHGRYRGWEKEGGQWHKRYIGNAGIHLTESEYMEYKATGQLPAGQVLS